MKRAKMLAIGMAAAVLLSGCSKFSPKETAVSIGKDGKITAAVIEKLDQDYYKEDELKSSIDKAVSDFVSSNGADSVSIEKYEAKDRNVSLFMEYADGDAYAQFNNVTFYAGDMVGAGGAGFDFDTTFQSVEKGEVTDKQVSNDEVLNSYNYNVVILEEQMSVEVPGNIVYVSANVEVTGKKSAKVVAEVSETEAETEKSSETGTESESETEVLSLSPAEDMETGEETSESETETETESQTEEETESTAKSAVAYIIYE